MEDVDRRKRVKIEDSKVKGSLVLINSHSFSAIADKVYLQFISADRCESTDLSSGETPEGLRHYRDEENWWNWRNWIRKREEWDRVYDYDVYNDLSEPDKGSETDPSMESRIGILQSLKIYVPRDERFSELKMEDVYAYGIKLVSQAYCLGTLAFRWRALVKIPSPQVIKEDMMHGELMKNLEENCWQEFACCNQRLQLWELSDTVHTPASNGAKGTNMATG
ncbi:hypothetical protein E3N88_43451 [Mikania micrantha]|uniref:Lipoxygenase domain-containing protein n=1 Tax=Mikania micrantha TaxID=192012 RepID=A0A5N6LEU2_9ASTR|nr:hypothetical protein E3N88_43451 [Mikania micrantha]